MTASQQDADAGPRPGALLRRHVAAVASRIQGGYVSNKGAAPTAASVQALATLRRAAGSAGGADPRSWSLVLDEMPEALLGQRAGRLSEPTRAERAALTALTTYAFHQQSQRQQRMHVAGVGLGQATRNLARQRGHGQGAELDSGTVDRMHKISLAQNEELRSHMLRALVTLMRSAERPVPLDYGLLAEDLYWLAHPTWAHRVHLRWGRDLYSRSKDESPAARGDQTPDSPDNPTGVPA